MTLATNSAVNNYVGSGITGPYPITFKFFADTDLIVTVADLSGVEATKVMTTDYTVTGAGSLSGGSLTFTAAIPSNYAIRIEPRYIGTQTTDIRNEGGNLREAIEDRFDRIVRDIQVINNDVSRSVKFQRTEGVNNSTLPPSSNGSLLGWSDDGTSIVNRSASLYGGDGLVTATGSTTARWLSDRFAAVANLKDFGAIGNGSADDTNAVEAAWAYASLRKSVVYVPPGVYRTTRKVYLTSAGPCGFVGDGPVASKFFCDNASDHGFDIVCTDDLVIDSLGFSCIDRNSGFFLVQIRNSYKPKISNSTFLAGMSDMLCLEGCIFAQLSNLMIQSNAGTKGGTCLRLKNASVVASNINARTANDPGYNYSESRPCLWMTGTSTASHFSNSTFSGGGIYRRATISGITSTSSAFTVTSSTAHGYVDGDTVVISGTSGYDGVYRIYSVGSSTFSVEDTRNLGTRGAVGEVQSMAACALIQSDFGACNESSFDGCLFEALRERLFGSVALLFDGRTPQSGNPYRIEGWSVTGCYFDFGAIGLAVLGGTGPDTIPSVRGITVTGCQFMSYIGIMAERAHSITVTGCHMERPAASYVGGQNNITYGVKIWKVSGFIFNSNHVGPRENTSAGSPVVYDYGMWIDGGTTIEDGLSPSGTDAIKELTIVGNQIHGQTAAIGDTGAPFQPGCRWNVNNNLLLANPWATRFAIPTVAVSSGSINLPPWHDVVRINGGGTATSINPQWTRKTVKLLVSGGSLSLATGGNIAASATYATGRVATIVADETNWSIS